MQQTLTSELVGERNEKCNPSYWYLANDKLFDFQVIISIKDRNYLQFAKKKYILKFVKYLLSSYHLLTSMTSIGQLHFRDIHAEFINRIPI